MGLEAPQRKKVHLNFFKTAYTVHRVPSLHSNSSNTFREITNTLANGPPQETTHAQKIALNITSTKLLAEKGKITSIFSADTCAGHSIYGGNMDAAFRAGTQVTQLGPLVIIPAMAV